MRGRMSPFSLYAITVSAWTVAPFSVTQFFVSCYFSRRNVGNRVLDYSVL